MIRQLESISVCRGDGKKGCHVGPVEPYPLSLHYESDKDVVEVRSRIRMDSLCLALNSIMEELKIRMVITIK